MKCNIKATTLWTITLEDGRIFKIASKKVETALNKIEKYYLNSNELLCYKTVKDIWEKEQPTTKWISYVCDGTGILI